MITRAELDEYRNEYQSLLEDRDDLKDQLDYKESQLYTIKNQKYSAVLGGHGDVDKIGAAVAEIEELREFYNAKVAECESMKARMESEFKKLEDIERKIMEYRYIDDLWWKDICVKVGYGWAQVHRIHRKSLTKLQHGM